MARTGYKITVYLDDNPNSETYLQTYEERTEDLEKCPINEDDLILVGNECEIVDSGYTGYRVLIYYNRATGEYSEVKELDPECEATSDEEQWVASGDPFCETTEQGINTGYMLQLLVQRNAMLPNYGATKYNRYKSPECGENNCPIWNNLEKSCHIAVNDCVATFDGTADIMQIDINPLSPTYNQTRTANKQDSDCENCTNTLFDWVWVGEMCGDDDLLCSNGIQQVSTNSYIVYRKYKTIGSGSPIPMDEYQVTLNEEDDEDCGFIRPQYKWEKQPGYLCDYETYTKYELYAKMVSYDEGVTWSIKQPYETQRGEVIAYDSYDCGKPMYRWIPTGEFTCVDNGDDGKIRYYSAFTEGEFDGLKSQVPCNESSVLTTNEAKSVTQTRIIRVGDCVNDFYASLQYYYDSVIWLGSYTEVIGANTLNNYNNGPRTLDIPENVKVINSNIPGGSYFEHIVMMPKYPISCSTSVLSGSVEAHSAIWVDAETYELWANDDFWGRYVSGGTNNAKLLPMNNDTIEWKMKYDLKSQFNHWSYFIPDGSDSATLTAEEGRYGRAIITKITFSDKIKSITAEAFGDRNNTYREFENLSEIDFGHGIETIGSQTFVGTSKLKSLHIPGNVKTIGYAAFSGDTIKSITFDEGIEYIGDEAFNGNICSAITIPDSVTFIGDKAFSQTKINGVNPLQMVYVKALVPPTITNTIFGTIGNYTVYVPCAAYEEYLNSTWASFHLAPYGCSGNMTAIAVLHQTDGTDVNVEVPSEYKTKILRAGNIDPYSATTSAITITTACTKMETSMSRYSGITTVTFESVMPPDFSAVYPASSAFINSGQMIYVPSNGYSAYTSELSEYEGKIIPIGASEEYVKRYTILDLYDRKKKDKYQLKITYNGQIIWKDCYRTDDIESGCYSVSRDPYEVVGGLGSELNTYKYVGGQITSNSLETKMVYITYLDQTNVNKFRVTMFFNNISSPTLTLSFRVQLTNNYSSGYPTGTIQFYSGDTEVTELMKTQMDRSNIQYSVNIPTSDGSCKVYFNFYIDDRHSSYAEYANGHTRWVTVSLDREIILATYNNI